MKAAHKLVSIFAAAVIVFAALAVVASPLPAQAQEIQVLSADPPSAPQGTYNLNVSIKGKGFRKGAQANFYVTGTTNPGGIVVHSTTFKGTTEVVANIDVADTAVISKFDIQVMTSDGRTGKGTEMFSVTKKTTSCVTPPELTLASCVSYSPGIPGCLDANFGGGTGRVLAPRGGYIRGLAIQNVGGEERIVAVGSIDDPCLSNDNQDWVVVRHHADGALDESFGSGGIVKWGSSYGTANAVLVQRIDNQNKLLVAGFRKSTTKRSLGYLPTVARYNENGSLDSTFGSGGVVTVPIGSGGVDAIALQSNNWIVATRGSAVFRLDPNGSQDATFNNNTGVYVHPTDGGGFAAIAVQSVATEAGSEERIVVAGRIYDSSWVGPRALLVRLMANGTLDTSFGEQGVVVEDFSGYGGSAAYYLGLTVDSINNRLLAVGDAATSSDTESGGHQMGMAIYDANGIRTRLVMEGFAGSGEAVRLQPDGKILVAGSQGNELGMTTWRFTADGVLDPSFGTGGFVGECFTKGGIILEKSPPDPIYSIHCGAWAWGLAQQADGKIVVGGRAYSNDGTSNYGHAALARYWTY